MFYLMCVICVKGCESPVNICLVEEVLNPQGGEVSVYCCLVHAFY